MNEQVEVEALLKEMKTPPANRSARTVVADGAEPLVVLDKLLKANGLEHRLGGLVNNTSVSPLCRRAVKNVVAKRAVLRFANLTEHRCELRPVV